LYGPLTLREEHRLRVFEGRVLSRIFGSKREEVVGGWRSLYNEELHNFYTSTYIISVTILRRMKWVAHVPLMEKMSNIYNILVGKKPLGRPRRKWEDNIRMDLTGTGSIGVDWLHLSQDRDQWWDLVNTVMNLPVP
jgi:hypothetical protein